MDDEWLARFELQVELEQWNIEAELEKLEAEFGVELTQEGRAALLDSVIHLDPEDTTGAWVRNGAVFMQIA